jgi:beta-glucanase (GH16 family)
MTSRILFCMMAISICVALVLSGCSTPNEPADTTERGALAGRIVGALNTPLAGVAITTDPQSDTVLTDAEGNFVLNNLPVGSYSVRAAKKGSSTSAYYSVALNDTTEVSIRLPLWKPSWNDEFDGTTINDSLWHIDSLPSGLKDLQVSSRDDAYIQSGILRLRLQKRQIIQGFPYTVGSLTGKRPQLYGRFEIRAKLPRGRGILAAHWLWNFHDSQHGVQEIDIMEVLGQAPSNIYMTYHFTDFQRVYGKRSLMEIGPDYSQDFHTYTVEWYPDEIRWFIDGDEKFRAPVIGQQEPLKMLLSNYIGGSWSGPPDSTLISPQYHDIDYVRAYEAAE